MSQPQEEAAPPPAGAKPQPAAPEAHNDRASLEANSAASDAAVQGNAAVPEDLTAGDTATSFGPGGEDRPTDEQILSYENQIR